MGLRCGSAENAGRRVGRCLSVSVVVVLALAAGCSSSSSSGSSGNTQGVHLTYALWDPVQEVGYKRSIALFGNRIPASA